MVAQEWAANIEQVKPDYFFCFSPKPVGSTHWLSKQTDKYRLVPVSAVSRLFCLSSSSRIPIRITLRYWIEFEEAGIFVTTMILAIEGQECQQELLLLQADANSAGCVPTAAHAPAEPPLQPPPQSSRSLIQQAPTCTEATGNLPPSWFSSLDFEGSRDSLKSPSFAACCSTTLWISSLGWGECFIDSPY